MLNEFVRIVVPTAVREYEECNTPATKLDSKMVRILKDELNDGVSVYALLPSLSARRIVVAVCAPRENLRPITYAIISGLAFLPSQSTVGTTADGGVNNAHYEYRGLSDGQLMELADAIARGTDTMDRDDVKKAALESVEIGAMRRNNIRFLSS